MPKQITVDASEELLTDTELCDRLRISQVTLRTHLRKGSPFKRNPNSKSIRDEIRHIVVGGRRRWITKSVDEFIHGQD
jgi:hypothetical protein